MDGNFKANHMLMKKSNGNVQLTDGEGYFVENGPYQRHLEHAMETKPVRN
jgi:hypothetical protein